MEESLNLYIIKDANSNIRTIYLSEKSALEAKAQLDKTCCDKCPFYYIEKHKIENNETNSIIPFNPFESIM